MKIARRRIAIKLLADIFLTANYLSPPFRDTAFFLPVSQISLFADRKYIVTVAVVVLMLLPLACDTNMSMANNSYSSFSLFQGICH